MRRCHECGLPLRRRGRYVFLDLPAGGTLVFCTRRCRNRFEFRDMGGVDIRDDVTEGSP